ncbi:hypothetical protein Hdeb2414_s0003g00082501 [Helianthus debilis subsp. tardiflorus]
MCDFWMGSYKLFIVIARFVDGEKVNAKKQEPKKKNVEKQPIVGNPVGDKKVGNVSFCDVVSNKKHVLEVLSIKIDSNVSGFVHWYGHALVDRVKDFKILTSLRGLMKEFGYQCVVIKYLGAFRVLLVFDDIELLNYFKDTEEAWKEWFVHLVLWEGQSFEYECVAWLKIHGVPVHLSINPMFNVIGSKFGKVIQEAQIDDEVGDLSYACIGVLCNSSRWNARLDLSWNDFVYKVWVEEETGEWIPDCLTMFDDESSSSEDGQSEMECDRNEDAGGLLKRSSEDESNKDDDNVGLEAKIGEGSGHDQVIEENILVGQNGSNGSTFGINSGEPSCDEGRIARRKTFKKR